MDKAELIEASVRCHNFGWLSLLPVAGIPFLMLAYTEWWRVRREAVEWNPASRQLSIGHGLSRVGLLINFATVVIVACLYAGNKF